LSDFFLKSSFGFGLGLGLVGAFPLMLMSRFRLKNRQEKKNNTEKHEEWRKKSEEESIKRNMEMELLRRKLEGNERD